MIDLGNMCDINIAEYWINKCQNNWSGYQGCYEDQDSGDFVVECISTQEYAKRVNGIQPI